MIAARPVRKYRPKPVEVADRFIMQEFMSDLSVLRFDFLPVTLLRFLVEDRVTAPAREGTLGAGGTRPMSGVGDLCRFCDIGRCEIDICRWRHDVGDAPHMSVPPDIGRVPPAPYVPHAALLIF